MTSKITYVSSVQTRTTRFTAPKRTVNRILFIILDLDASDPRIKALSDAGTESVKNLLLLADQNINFLEYDSSGCNRRHVLASKRNFLKALESFNFYLLVKTQVKKVDWDYPNAVKRNIQRVSCINL